MLGIFLLFLSFFSLPAKLAPEQLEASKKKKEGKNLRRE
jgi:hypothetical protein